MTAAITNSGDGVSFTGYAGSATIGPFSLLGGLYALAISDTGTPDVTLSALLPDGTTYAPVAAAVVANGATTYSLPPGKYEITTGTGTLLQGSLIRVPYSRY